VAQDTASTSSVRSQIIPLLTQTIDWFRHTQQEQHLATEPSDLTFLADNRRIADQVVSLAFAFARQEEQRPTKQSKANEALNPSGALSEYENLVQTSAETDQLVQQTQGEVESLKQGLEKAPASKRSRIAAQLSETQSELALFQARQQGLHSMLDFLNEASTATGTVGLRSQIEELARSVPTALSNDGGSASNPPANQQPSPAATNIINKLPSANMWALAEDLFQLSSKRHTLLNEMDATEALEQSSQQLRAPLINRFRQLIETGNQLAKQADTSNQQGLTQERQQLETLTAEYKQLSATLAPLSKQAILLDLYKRNLSNWQADVRGEFKDKIKSLLLRLAGLAMVLGAVFVIGEIWRKAIFRYVHDSLSVLADPQDRALDRSRNRPDICLCRGIGSACYLRGPHHCRRRRSFAERHRVDCGLLLSDRKIRHSGWRSSTGGDGEWRSRGNRTGAISSDGAEHRRGGCSAYRPSGSLLEFGRVSVDVRAL